MWGAGIGFSSQINSDGATGNGLELCWGVQVGNEETFNVRKSGWALRWVARGAGGGVADSWGASGTVGRGAWGHV